LASYVVHLIGCDDTLPFKHFRSRADAVAYGKSRVQSGEAERANIHEIADADDAGAAIALWRAGNAAHIQTCSKQPSDSEIEAAQRHAFETARKGGARAVLKFLGLIPRDAPDPPKFQKRKL
jgi:hypothetical protein